MSNVIHPNEIEFNELYNSQETLFIDFYASWCGPCQMLAPSIDQLASQHPNIKVIKIDVDAYPQLAAKLNVQSIPSLFVVKNSQITNRQLGFVPYHTLEKMLEG